MAVSTDVARDLVEIARSLEPLIRQYDAQIEGERTLPKPIVDALYDSGVFKTFWAREVGGLEVEPVEWLQMIEELSRINASVGWLAMINAGAGMSSMTPEVFDEVRALTGGRYISATNFGRRAGVAKKVEGGYRISGRWPFVSGSPHATWVGGSSILYDDNDEMVIHPDGQPWIISAQWPLEQATLIDTWDGLGLRGTGSGDMEVTDLFVPTEHVNELGFSDQTYDRPLFRLKEALFMSHGAHALGIAVAAQEGFLEQVRMKAAHGSVRQMALGRMQGHQIAYGKSDALVRAARAFLHQAVGEAYADVSAHPGEPAALELRVQMRESMLFAVRSCKEAVNLVFEMAGSSAVYTGRPLERAFRDMSTAANHMIVTETEYASVGSYHLTKDLVDGPLISGRKFI